MGRYPYEGPYQGPKSMDNDGLWAVFRGLGLLFYRLLGSRYQGRGKMGHGWHQWGPRA